MPTTRTRMRMRDDGGDDDNDNNDDNNNPFYLSNPPSIINPKAMANFHRCTIID